MSGRRARAVGAAVVAAAVPSVAWPQAASAHGLVGKQDLPIPQWLFAWAAALVLVVSFVALAVLWPKPRLAGPEVAEGRRVLPVPRILDPLLGLLGVAVFAGVVYAGLAGTKSPEANVEPTFVYVITWVGVPFLTMVFGDVFRAVNPWRAIARAVAWIAARAGLGGGDAPAALPYPERLGRWPAAVGILAFAWLELAYANKDDPRVLAVLALLYAAVQLIAMSLYGIERWSDRGDALGVYFGLYARVSPLRWRRGELRLRPVLGGLPSLDAVPGTVPLLCVMIGSTSFDGFSNSSIWTSMAEWLQRRFLDLGLSAEPALEATFTVGLLMMVAVVALIYRVGVSGMHSMGGSTEGRAALGRRFVHSLVPIALAYVVAHYFSLLAYQGQAMGYLASDPLGDGSDLLGLSGSSIDYGVVSASAVWYVQVVALVAGHACGLALAHDHALATYGDARRATRSQYWMLVVMVGFTSLGLWILSAAS